MKTYENYLNYIVGTLKYYFKKERLSNYSILKTTLDDLKEYNRKYLILRYTQAAVSIVFVLTGIVGVIFLIHHFSLILLWFFILLIVIGVISFILMLRQFPDPADYTEFRHRLEYLLNASVIDTFSSSSIIDFIKQTSPSLSNNQSIDSSLKLLLNQIEILLNNNNDKGDEKFQANPERRGLSLIYILKYYDLKLEKEYKFLIPLIMRMGIKKTKSTHSVFFNMIEAGGRYEDYRSETRLKLLEHLKGLPKVFIDISEMVKRDIKAIQSCS